MDYCKGVQRIEVFENEHIIKSTAVGVSSIEDTQWLKDKIIELSSKWKGEKWVYIADISKLEPVSIEVSLIFVQLHTEIYENGCVGIGFVEKKDVFTSKQASVHQKMSSSDLKEGHFSTYEEVHDWAISILSE